MQKSSLLRLLLYFLAKFMIISASLNDSKTPDPAGCPSDQFLAKLPDGTWDCLFCTLSCPPGTEKETQCTRERDLQCRECPDGTFNDGTNVTCRNCSVCLHSHVIKNCSSKNDTVCKYEFDDETDNIWLMIAAGVAAACVFVIIIIETLLWWCRQRRNKNNLTSHTDEMTSASHTHEGNDVNTSLLNGEQCVKTQTSTITEAHNTTGEAIEDTNKGLDGGEEDNGSEINYSSHEVSSEPKSNQSSDFFKTVAGHALKNLASNDPITACQFG